jgi:hypothetical protein
MDLVRLLRGLIALEAVLTVIAFMAHPVFDAMLPDALQAWVNQRAEAAFEPSDYASTGAGFALLGAACVSWYGLWRFRPWAPTLYACTWGIEIALIALIGPSVQAGPAAALTELGVGISGLMLGIAWFSDLRHRYAEPFA